MSVLEHTRAVTESEVETLRLVQSPLGPLALMPVFYNGQERFALVMLSHSSMGGHVRLLAIVPDVADQILDAAGNEPTRGMPASVPSN